MSSEQSVASDGLHRFLAFYINVDLLEDLAKNLFVLVFQSEPIYILNVFLIIPAVLYALVLMCLRRLDGRFAAVLIVYGALYLLSIALTPEIIPILLTALIRGFLYVIIPVFIMSQVHGFDDLLDALKPYVLAAIVYTATQFILRSSTVVVGSYMEYSYNCMVPMLTALAISMLGVTATSTTERVWALASFALLFASNILIGGRGSILCVAICVILLLYFLPRKTQVLYIACLALVGLLVFVNMDQILNFMHTAFPYSRTITRASENIIVDTTTSYRATMWRFIANSFINDPFAIRGFLSDRITLSQLFYDSNTIGMYGFYAHNIVFELLFQFGCFAIPPIVFGAIFASGKIRSAKRSGNLRLACLLSVSLAFCLGQLLVSGSYLTAESFGIVLGLLLYAN